MKKVFVFLIFISFTLPALSLPNRPWIYIEEAFINQYQNKCFTFSSQTIYNLVDQYFNDEHIMTYVIEDPSSGVAIHYDYRVQLVGSSKIRFKIEDIPSLTDGKTCFAARGDLELLKKKVDKDGNRYFFIISRDWNAPFFPGLWILESHLKAFWGFSGPS